MSIRMTPEAFEAHQQRVKGVPPLYPQRTPGETVKVRKYRNVPTEVGGIVFASRKEAGQWQKLLLREGSGQIRGLQRQVPYPMVINGIPVCEYIADWTYYEGDTLIVGDCKGRKTDLYRLKAKLMLALYGITIRET